MMEFLAENLLLIVGLGFGALLVGLKALAAKTETKLDDEVVQKVEENKAPIVEKIAGLIKGFIKK